MNAYIKKNRLLSFYVLMGTWFVTTQAYAELKFEAVQVTSSVAAGQQNVLYRFRVSNTSDNDVIENLSYKINFGQHLQLQAVSATGSSTVTFAKGVITGNGGSLIEASDVVYNHEDITVTVAVAPDADGLFLISGTATGTLLDSGTPVRALLPTITVLQVDPPLAIGAITANAPTSCTATTGSLTVRFSGGTPNFTARAEVGGVIMGSETGATSPLIIANLPINENYTVSVTDSAVPAETVTSPQPIFLPAATNTVVLGEIVPKAVSCFGADNGELTTSFTGTTGHGFTVTATGVTPGTTSKAISASVDGAGFGSATISGLGAGNYNITVDDSNTKCAATSTTSVTVATPDPIIIEQPSTTPETCLGSNDGTITVSVSGGTGSYTVEANPVNRSFPPTLVKGSDQAPIALTGLQPVLYDLTVIDSNGCLESFVAPVSIGTASEVTISNTVGTNVSCFGGNDGHITVQMRGGTGVYTITATPILGFDNSIPPVKVPATDLAPAIIPNLSAGIYAVSAVDSNNCVASNQPNVTITSPTELLATLTINNESCAGFNDGSVTVVATGGTAPFQFSNQGGAPGTFMPSTTDSFMFSPLAPGAYSIVVLDSHGCETLPVAAVVNTATPIVVSGRALAPTCPGGNDGQIIITATGGTPPLMFALATTPPSIPMADNVIRGLTSGNYQVVVTDANGCTGFSDIINVPPAIPFFIESVAITPISCAGAIDATITVDVSGGLAPVQFTLDKAVGPSTNPVFTNVGPGVHTITVTDANTPPCTLNYTTQAIIDPKPVTITGVVTAPPLCAGQSNGKIVVLVSGGTQPYSFSIDGGATSSPSNEFTVPAGTYSVVVRDSRNCTANTITTVAAQPAVVITSIATTNVSCFGGTNGSITINATGGAGGFTFSIDAGTTFTSNNTFTNLQAGTYFIEVMDQNGCIAKGTVTINQPQQLIISGIQTQEMCVNGSQMQTIAIVATGGMPPLMFSINGGGTFKSSNVFANVPVGTFTIVVKDANGCTATTMLTVS